MNTTFREWFSSSAGLVVPGVRKLAHEEVRPGRAGAAVGARPREAGAGRPYEGPWPERLCASEANSCAMLKEERATTLTQFLVTRLVLQGGEEADGPLVSQEVQETSWLSRQGVVAPAAGNLRFWTGLLFLSRASVGSDADGHTTVGSLQVEHRGRSAGLVRSE